MPSSLDALRASHAAALAAYYGVPARSLTDAQVTLWAARSGLLRPATDAAPTTFRDAGDSALLASRPER